MDSHSAEEKRMSRVQSRRSSLTTNKVSSRSQSEHSGHAKRQQPPTPTFVDNVSAEEVQTEQPELPSLYDQKRERFADAKLLSNKVHVQWYRRYIDAVPNCKLYFQPYNEIQKREEEIALQFYYGKDYRPIAERTDAESKIERAVALRRYYKMKQIMKERGQAEFKVSAPTSKVDVSRTGSSEDVIGVSVNDRSIMQPIVNYFCKLHQKRNRLTSTVMTKKVWKSKWTLFHTPLFRLKIKKVSHNMERLRVRKKFLRIIRLVQSVQKFLYSISEVARDTIMFSRALVAFQFHTHLADDAAKQSTGNDRLIFNPDHYKLHLSDHLEMPVKLALTTPWFRRSEEEINVIMESLQKMKTFVAYPVSFQKIIATAAWYIEVPHQRVIIRQRHTAMDFYFILSGKVRVEKLVGSPDYNEASEFENVKMLKKHDMFGDECINRPLCDREYSAISEMPSEMLSVNMHDFFQVIMYTKSKETAPEHLRFLSNLQFLTNFPKPVLLQEAEGNISLFHFVTGSLITSNVAEADFVYVVSYGSCSVLVELLPPAHLIYAYEERKRKSSQVSAMKSRLPSKTKLEEQADERASRRAIWANIKRDIERNSRLAEKCHVEIGRRSINMIEQSSEIIENTRKIKDKLGRNQTTGSIGRSSPGSARQIIDDHSKTRERKLSRRSIHFTMGKTEKEGADETTIDSKKVKSRLLSRRDGTTRSVIVGSNMDLQSAALKALTLPATPIPEVGVPSFFCGASDTASSLLSTSTAAYKQRLSKASDGSGKIKSSGSHGSSIARSTKAKSTKSKSSSIRQQVIEEPSKLHGVCPHSRWKMKKSIIKGDVVGTEWLDYNDGPFEPPKETWSLVSQGATVIMVRKTLLLKYLRKSW